MTTMQLTIKDTAIITKPEDIAEIRQEWLEGKKRELESAKVALDELGEVGASERKIRRTKERVGLLKKVVRCLENGFIPIPRFDSNRLRLENEELPLSAITAVKEATAQKIFDEFRIVQGREAMNQRGPRGRLARRDPIIVGVVRTPELQDQDRPWNVWSMEEHFLVAWWRPEDQHPQDAF